MNTRPIDPGPLVMHADDGVCPMCNGKGTHAHAISGETHGPDVDAERQAWAERHPVTCSVCDGTGKPTQEKPIA